MGRKKGVKTRRPLHHDVLASCVVGSSAVHSHGPQSDESRELVILMIPSDGMVRALIPDGIDPEAFVRGHGTA